MVVADHQRAGRGRLDRSWHAPPGASLLVSILFRPSLPTADAHLLTTAVGVSAAQACRSVSGVEPLLKWPNDLVVAAADAPATVRKLGGILAESTVEGARLEAVVVGIGVNVNWPTDLPPELAEIATALNHLTGAEVDREALLIAMLVGLDELVRRRRRAVRLGAHPAHGSGSGAFRPPSVAASGSSSAASGWRARRWRSPMTAPWWSTSTPGPDGSVGRSWPATSCTSAPPTDRSRCGAPSVGPDQGSRSRAMSAAKAAAASTVQGPGQVGKATPSTRRMGCTSRRGRRQEGLVGGGQRARGAGLISSTATTSHTSSRVIPARQPDDSGGVHRPPSTTTKTLLPVPFAQRPRRVGEDRL